MRGNQKLFAKYYGPYKVVDLCVAKWLRFWLNGLMRKRFLLFQLSTMRSWFFGKGGFDTVKEGGDERHV